MNEAEPMTDISAAVAKAMENIVASGHIERTIEAALSRTISESIDQHTRSYSEFGKAISEKVKAAIGANLDKIELPEYHAIMLEMISRKLDECIKIDAAKGFKELMDKTFEPAPAEMKFSDLVEQFKEWVADNDYEDRSGGEVTVRVEEPKYSFMSSRWVRMDKEADKKDYDCEFSFLISEDGTISAIRCSGKNPKQDLFIGGYYGFERSLFRLHVGATKIILDDFDTYMPGHD
jgi:hypothetical protein